jgi:hypothetical protein
MCCYLVFNSYNVSNIRLYQCVCHSCVVCFYLICICSIFLVYSDVSLFPLFSWCELHEDRTNKWISRHSATGCYDTTLSILWQIQIKSSKGISTSHTITFWLSISYNSNTVLEMSVTLGGMKSCKVHKSVNELTLCLLTKPEVSRIGGISVEITVTLCYYNIKHFAGGGLI